MVLNNDASVEPVKQGVGRHFTDSQTSKEEQTLFGKPCCVRTRDLSGLQSSTCVCVWGGGGLMQYLL
jgi:hypothetical protein